MDEYIDYVNGLDNEVDLIAQVDTIPGSFGVIRTADETVIAPELSWQNYLYMRDKIISVDKLVPIFHQDEDFKWFKEYVRMD